VHRSGPKGKAASRSAFGRRGRRGASVVLAAFVWFAASGVFAQEWGEGFLSAEEREALYAQLATEVEHLERQGNILKAVVKLVSPTVVHIVAEKDGDSSRRREPRIEEAGSGVVLLLEEKHYVLTNRHVIHEARWGDIAIHLDDGRTLTPEQVWSDPGTDVAVMAIEAPDLVPARLGDSSRLEIGDFVLAVGSPFGLSHSVTYGIISAKGRRELVLGDDVEFQDFLQTDAAINPGNSGGPLINLRGEVIGINTAIASNSGGNEGIGFSIPINMALHVARQLIEYGSVRRAFLGVTLDRDFDARAAVAIGLRRRGGAKITSLTKGAPAESADLRVGDVILRFNDTPVDDDTHLVNLVSMSEIDSEAVLVVFRDGKTFEVRLRVGDANKLKRRSSSE
jgi:serine protease Do